MENIEILTIIFIVSCISLTSASICPNNVYPCDSKVQFNNPQQSTTQSINYSLVNVNNSQYLNSHPDTYFCINSTLSQFVPYTGASQNVNLGNNNLNVTNITSYSILTSFLGSLSNYINSIFAVNLSTSRITSKDNSSVGIMMNSTDIILGDLTGL